MKELLKDDKLDFILNVKGGNIARFISITPDKKIKYNHICESERNIPNIKEAIIKLINSSNSKSINIRSFSLDKMKGNRLIYNKTIDDLKEILDIIDRNCEEEKYSIINENIDINDGGVSGVALGNIIEFAPNDTPKCVEKNGVCHVERKMGYHILKTVYGFYPEIDFEDNYRVEFSIHPKREGIKNKHTIIWEYENFDNFYYEPKLKFPNRFSEFIGDKTFGLIIADYLGFNVPYTTVISRNVAPFSFGKKTTLKENWIRTAPVVKMPGKFYTGDKWIDPFLLMQKEEKKGDYDINIASILSQNAVDAVYSGAAIISIDKSKDIIEGVKGNGDEFMVGSENKNNLPNEVMEKLKQLLEKIRFFNNILGDVSIEWVYDGDIVWIVQLNQIECKGEGNIIVFGNPSYYDKFYVKDGLEKFRSKIKEIEMNSLDIGIELVGDVGICSHFGDLLRHANIPSFISK